MLGNAYHLTPDRHGDKHLSTKYVSLIHVILRKTFML